MRALACELLRLRKILPPSSGRRKELLEEIADLFAEYLEYSGAIHEQ